MIVDAGAGDDVFFGYEAAIRKFDGGQGFDTASYAKLSSQELATGVNFFANGSNTITVTKLITEGTKYYQESIKTRVEHHGKRKESIEYRAVSLTELDDEILLSDNLMNIEVLQGSSLGDYFDISRSTQVQVAMGFEGDDEFVLNDAIKMVVGGDGHDTIHISTSLLKKLLKTKDVNDAVLIDGGAGNDTLAVTSESFAHLKDILEQSKILDDMVAEIAESLLPPNTPNRDVEFAKISVSLKSMLSDSMGLSLNKLQFKEMDNIAFELEDSANDFSAFNEQRVFNLEEKYEISNFIGSSIDADGNVTEMGVSVSGAEMGGAITVLGSQGSDAVTGSRFTDVLMGNDGDDKLTGGKGNDILVGGAGNDIYKIGLHDGHNVIAFENFEELNGDIVEVAETSDADFYRFNQDLVLKVSDDSSLTIANYFDSVDTSKLQDPFASQVSQEKLYGALSNNGGANGRTYPLMAGDVNGDGFDDLVSFDNYASYVALGYSGGLDRGYVYGGWSHGKEEYWTSWDNSRDQYYYPRTLSDLNGDRRT